MKRLFAALAVVCGTLGCKVDLKGTCSKDSDCKSGLTCDSSVDPHVCVSACDPVCGATETCANAKCVSTGPIIAAVRVTDNPAAGLNGFYARTAANNIPVSVDVSPGFGGQIASVFLTVNGKRIDLDSSSVNGTVSTYNFTVPTLDAPAGTDGPLLFQVSATDASSNLTQVTPSAGLKIDDAGPVVRGVAVDATVSPPEATVSNVPWFKQSAGGDIDVKATIVDPGTGVDIATVMLIGTSGRIDKPGLVTRDAGTDNYHFKVARGGGTPVANGAEALVNFHVASSDVLAHPQTADSGTNVSTGSLGIDGKAPAINLTISAGGTPVNYPPAGTDCDTDTTLYCGHDGTHFWRRGAGAGGAETTPISFTLTEAGSGVDPANPTCAIDGVATCTVSASGATFSFTPNFTTATFTSSDAGTGGGSATITVNATDRVGNAAPAKVQTAQVSRIKWVQKLTSRTQGVTVLRGSPIVTTVPVPQIIVAGTRTGTNDPLVSVKPTGGVLWQSGNTQTVGNVSSNMLYDPTSAADPMLYVMQPTKVVAIHMTPAGPDTSFSCSLTAPAPTAALFGGGTTARILAIQTRTIVALSAAPAGGCSTIIPSATLISSGNVGAPTTNGSIVYVAYDNTGATANDLGIITTTFDGTNFSIPTKNALAAAPYTPSALSTVSIADDLFFGDGLNTKKVYRFSPAFSAVWSGAASTASSAPTVARGLVLSESGAPTNNVTAFNKSSATTTGTVAFTYPTTGGIGSISPIATGPNGTLYFTDSSNNELLAIAPNGTAQWNLTGVVPADAAVALAGVGTEPSLDDNGILYFGQDSGNLYAVITDGTSTPPPAGSGADWPRVGFDRCNSANASFTNCR